MAVKVDIVIIGGSFAGILSAHEILKTIPNAKVTIINASKKFFSNIASPRILAKPAAIKPDDYFLDIETLFGQYSTESFVFVEGRVTSINTTAKSVVVEDRGTIPYDYLVIASGSTTSSTLEQSSDPAPWKSSEKGNLQDLIEKSQEKITNAKTIIIGGAGPVGVEFAGELAETLTQDGEKRTITLVSATNQILPALREAVGSHAENILKSQGVHVRKGSRVVRAVQNRQTNKWTVTLENGHQEEADVYISSAGALPNNGFIPLEFLSTDGWVVVDENLRAKSNNVSATESKQQDKLLPIFALGDITIHEPRLVGSIQEQVPVLVANLKADINGNDDAPRLTYSPSPISRIMIPIGSSNGTGLLFGMVPWSTIVWLIKGRTYLIPWVKGVLSGK